ncbi:MAG: metal-dependent hydrolase [Robiginitomaculum sp.]
MFIGHYAAAPLAAASGKLKLWHAFIAVQFVDIIWAIFMITGIEQGRVIPDFTQANALDMHFMPYSHSLLFTAGWAIIGALGFKAFTRARGWGGAGIFGALVLSHWVGDVIVHVPDMTFWPGSSKIGFGLWNHVMLSFPLELLTMFAALWIYIRATKPVSKRAKMWTGLLVLFLGALQVLANFGPPPTSMTEVGISALIVFALLAFIASRYEKTRGSIGI